MPGFYEAVRAFILHIVGINFQKVSSQTLGEYLQIDAASLKALIAEKTKSAGWKAEGAIVVLPRNAYNQPVTQRSQDIIKFDQVAPVLNKLTVGM